MIPARGRPCLNLGSADPSAGCCYPTFGVLLTGRPDEFSSVLCPADLSARCVFRWCCVLICVPRASGRIGFLTLLSSFASRRLLGRRLISTCCVLTSILSTIGRMCSSTMCCPDFVPPIHPSNVFIFNIIARHRTASSISDPTPVLFLA